MDDFVELQTLSTPHVKYYFDKPTKGFVMENLSTHETTDLDFLEPELMAKFHKVYPQLSRLLTQHTPTNSYFFDPAIPLVKESDKYSIYYNTKEGRLIQVNKETGHETKTRVSEENLAQMAPNTQEMIRSNLKKLKVEPVADFNLRKSGVLQNDDVPAVPKPKKKSIRTLFKNKKAEDILPFQKSNVDSQLQSANDVNISNDKEIVSTGEPKWCEKFQSIFSTILFLMVVVWIFNLGYSYGKYFTQIKVLNPRLVQFYYIYSAICMFVTIALMASLGKESSPSSYWYLIFALFGIGHITTSAVVLSIVVPKMDRDPSLQVLKSNVKAHLVIDIINGILMVICALGTHYCKYDCILRGFSNT